MGICGKSKKDYFVLAPMRLAGKQRYHRKVVAEFSYTSHKYVIFAT